MKRLLSVVRGRKGLLTFSGFGITTPHQRGDSLCPLASPEVASYLPPPLAGCAVLGWRGLSLASPGLWSLAHSTPVWRGFLRWVALQVGTWRWPPTFLTCGSRYMIQRLSPLLLKEHKGKWNHFLSLLLFIVNIYPEKVWVPIFVGFRETCCCWKLQKPSGSFWWAQQSLLQCGADRRCSGKIYYWWTWLRLDGSHLRVNNFTLESLREEESTLPLIKSTTKFNTEENMVIKK